MGEGDTDVGMTGAADPTADHFGDWVGRSIASAATGVRLVLDGIDASGTPFPSGRRPFVLVFSGEPVLPPDPRFLGEGTYACGPEGGPTRAIHLSPIRSRSTDRQDCRAVFA